MAKKKLRIGLIGLGGIAHMAHFRAFGRLPKQCELVAGCDIDEAKFPLAEKKSAIRKFYTDYNKMFAKEKLDAVVVGTPNGTHAEISIAALEAGINVLCEKPVTISVEQARAIQRAEKKSRAKLMVGMCFRFRADTPVLQDLLRTGALGEVYYCKASYLRTRGIPGWGTWFTDKSQAGGGVVLDLGVHLMDYIWFLLGKPAIRSVSATTYNGIGKRHLNGEPAAFGKVEYPSTYTGPVRNCFDVEEMGSMLIRFEGGVVYHLEASWAMNYDDSKYINGGMLLGDRGGARFSPVVYTHEVDGKLIHEALPTPETYSHDNQAEIFLKFLRGEMENPAPIADGIQIMRALEAAYRSAKLGREVALTEVK